MSVLLARESKWWSCGLVLSKLHAMVLVWISRGCLAFSSNLPKALHLFLGLEPCGASRYAVHSSVAARVARLRRL